MSLPNPVEQKSHDVINNKLSRVMKEVAEESMKMAAVEEYSSSPDNLLTVSGDGTWKTRGHSSLIGVCTVIGAETGKVLDREVLSSFCKGCDSYKGVKFGIKYNKNGKERIRFHVKKNYSGSAGKMEVDGMLRIFNRSEKLHNLKYSNYIGDGDTKTFNALSENKPYGDDYLIQKIECVGHVQKRMGRLTDSLIDKLAHYYGNAIRCNSTSVKEMRKAIWAVFGVILAALMMNRCTGFVLQIQIHGKATRERRHFEFRSSDEDNTRAVTLLEDTEPQQDKRTSAYSARRGCKA
ncbi:uncharacterized protein TNCV_1146991 [Trichonephila clavipes]|nr:uncharacterized protein TNCV_1146991 [Trichonephila clavipes]